MVTGRRPKVVIIGAGFGGLWAARTLAGAPVDVLLIDRNNYHTFLPLLYQIAAAEIEPEAIIYPVRSILRRHRNVRFALANVTSIDMAAKKVIARERDISYDYLIIATGSETSFFGVPGAEEYAFPLKTMEEATALRNHILCRFETATLMDEPDRQKRALTFVIVGGGPTGVEFAGALAELVQRPLRRDYPRLDFKNVRMILIEAVDRLLYGQHERLGSYAKSHLEKMGVEVLLNSTVSEVTPAEVRLKDGTVIPTETVVWTGGVRGCIPDPGEDVPTARNSRIKVLPTLQMPDYPDVYVAGDLAYTEDDDGPTPMVAPSAIQQGTTAAGNVLRQIRGHAPVEFRYKDPGSMATVGRNAGVAQLKGRAFVGFPAWLMWVAVHIFKLIGFRNRIFVLINWAWDYFFFERAVRLILPGCRHTHP